MSENPGSKEDILRVNKTSFYCSGNVQIKIDIWRSRCTCYYHRNRTFSDHSNLWTAN